MDLRLVKIIEKMDPEGLLHECDSGAIEACGAGPISVLLKLAKKEGHDHIKTLCYRHSGEVSGDMERVVGYLAAAVW
jgi:AmmeMemoRadiSam system protein B